MVGVPRNALGTFGGRGWNPERISRLKEIAADPAKPHKIIAREMGDGVQPYEIREAAMRGVIPRRQRSLATARKAELVRDRYLNGEPLNALAHEQSMHPHDLALHLRAMGLDVRSRAEAGALRAKKTRDHVSQLLSEGIEPSKLPYGYYIRKEANDGKPFGKRGQKENDAIRQRIIEMFKNGWTYRDIANELGVTRNRVAGIIDRNRGNIRSK